MAASVGPRLARRLQRKRDMLIGVFEASSEVGPFYSRFDARPGEPDLSGGEAWLGAVQRRRPLRVSKDAHGRLSNLPAAIRLLGGQVRDCIGLFEEDRIWILKPPWLAWPLEKAVTAPA